MLPETQVLLKQRASPHLQQRGWWMTRQTLGWDYLARLRAVSARLYMLPLHAAPARLADQSVSQPVCNAGAGDHVDASKCFSPLSVIAAVSMTVLCALDCPDASYHDCV